ncbi:MAG: glycosyltransferase [Candidatus Thorarchaeota archaeon]
MVGSPLISVITPIHTSNHRIPEIRRALSLADAPTQLIMVLNNPILIQQIKSQRANEMVVVARRRGRGFAFLQGMTNITGAITLLLHSDTVPLEGWDRAIIAAMEDPEVVGGGFAVAYDTHRPYYDLGLWMLNQWFRISGEFYGDHAMFIRTDVLKSCMEVLEVPLFEDLRLAKCMRKFGRVVLLEKRVETSAEEFRKRGVIPIIAEFMLCRVWYALGGSPLKIYNHYYSTS